MLNSSLNKLSSSISLLEVCSRILLIPWTFHHLQIALNLSINRSISMYGLLMSSFMGGRVLGRNIFCGYPGIMTSKLCYLTCFIITISFLILSISTRYSVVCTCFFLIGFSGGIIRTCYYKDEDITSLQYKTISNNNSFQNVSLYKESIALIFVPLFVGLTYNSAATSRFPALILCFTTALISILVFLAQCFSQTRIFKTKGKQTTSITNNSKKSSKFVPKKDTKKIEVIDTNSIDPPKEFIDLCSGDREAAKKKYHKTLIWKAENSVDSILDIPQDFFDEILMYYPHGIQGRSYSGAVVCYEQIGRGSAGELQKRGVTPEHILRHFMLRNEFILQRCKKSFRDGDISSQNTTLQQNTDNNALCTNLMTVLDVKGIKFSDFSGDVLRFIQLSADVMDNHYPGCVERLVICNTPSWFYSIWSVVARVLPESIKKKIVTIDNLSKLDEFIDPKMRPPEYGGTGTPLRESPDHKALIEVAAKWKELESDSNITKQDNQITKSKVVSETVESPKKGMWSWLSGKKTSSSTEAYLGESNKFYYDATSGRWLLEDETWNSNKQTLNQSSKLSNSNSNLQESIKVENNIKNNPTNSTINQSEKKGLTLDQIEEHGLVLAIQAAHHASRIQQQNLSSYSSSHNNMLASPGSSVDFNSDREESGLNINTSSNQLGTPRERKTHPKFITRSRSLPPDQLSIENTSNQDDSNDGYVHFEEKPSAELFLVVLGMHMMSCLLLGTMIVNLPIWMTLPYRGGGLGYSVRDCAVVISTAGVMILLTQINTDQRIKVALRAFPVRTFRVGVGSLAFFSFLMTQFARINRLKYSEISQYNNSIEMIQSNDSSYYGLFVWLIHVLLGIEQYISPSSSSSSSSSSSLSSDNSGSVISGSYWIPTPSGNPLTMIIPGILVGAIICSSYLTRKSAATLLHISLSSVISSPSKVQHCMSGAAAILAPSTSCLLLRWSHHLHLKHPMDDSFFLTLVGCAALLLYILSLMLTVKFRGEFGVLADDASVSLYDTDNLNLNDKLKTLHGKTPTTLGLTEVLGVPFEDLRHLRALFPGGKKNRDTGVLSARLFSLKLDLKDA